MRVIAKNTVKPNTITPDQIWSYYGGTEYDVTEYGAAESDYVGPDVIVLRSDRIRLCRSASTGAARLSLSWSLRP